MFGWLVQRGSSLRTLHRNGAVESSGALNLPEYVIRGYLLLLWRNGPFKETVLVTSMMVSDYMRLDLALGAIQARGENVVCLVLALNLRGGRFGETQAHWFGDLLTVIRVQHRSIDGC